MQFFCVALGGALGALGRYLVSLVPIKTEFPILTLFTNIVGAVPYWFCGRNNFN
jgi:CrcB protein